jgi:hypothetical protein
MDAAPAARRWTAGRITTTLIVVALVSMWGYVIYLAFGPGRADNPDKLHDPTFSLAAQERCGPVRADIDALPVASEFKGRPQARAAQIEQVNVELEAMLADLRPLVPGGDDGRVVNLWLDDWSTFLADRVDYAARLLQDDKARFLVTEKNGRQINVAIDDFAAVNHMKACATPPDV